uniref:Fucosyltransferase N-terminal domain-containing protein n=1 Tax=Daphnia galeata TaxID=27404 RepID=A0A8J2RTU7_9CRUS|nr:unnamed protein product [Daphnia galeata]
MVSQRVSVVTAKLCHIRFTLYFLLVLLYLLTVSLIFFSQLGKSPYYYYHPRIKNIRLALNNLPPLNQYGDADTEIGNNVINDVKRILFWTTFFGVKDYGFGIGRDVFAIAKCPVNNCETTTDRNVLNQSDAVIFHPYDVNVKDLPRHRAVHQRYIFFFFEAHQSYRNYPIFQNSVTNINFFNWTMTYRRDSDVYDSRYGNILRRRLNQSDDRLPATLSPEDSPPNPSSFWQLNELIYSSTVSNKTKTGGLVRDQL